MHYQKDDWVEMKILSKRFDEGRNAWIYNVCAIGLGIIGIQDEMSAWMLHVDNMESRFHW